MVRNLLHFPFFFFFFFFFLSVKMYSALGWGCGVRTGTPGPRVPYLSYLPDPHHCGRTLYA